MTKEARTLPQPISIIGKSIKRGSAPNRSSADTSPYRMPNSSKTPSRRAKVAFFEGDGFIGAELLLPATIASQRKVRGASLLHMETLSLSTERPDQLNLSTVSEHMSPSPSTAQRDHVLSFEVQDAMNVNEIPTHEDVVVESTISTNLISASHDERTSFLFTSLFPTCSHSGKPRRTATIDTQIRLQLSTVSAPLRASQRNDDSEAESISDVESDESRSTHGSEPSKKVPSLSQRGSIYQELPDSGSDIESSPENGQLGRDSVIRQDLSGDEISSEAGAGVMEMLDRGGYTVGREKQIADDRGTAHMQAGGLRHPLDLESSRQSRTIDTHPAINSMPSARDASMTARKPQPARGRTAPLNALLRRGKFNLHCRFRIMLTLSASQRIPYELAGYHLRDGEEEDENQTRSEMLGTLAALRFT